MGKVVTPPGELIDLPQGRLHYRWLGEGDRVLVLVHGLTTPSFVWHKLAPMLTEQGYRLLMFDHFGRGFSDFLQVRYDYDFYTKTIDDLLNALGIADPVDMMGYSMGGGIVAVYAHDRPARIRRMIALAPVGFRPDLGNFLGFLARSGGLGDVINWAVAGAIWRRIIRQTRNDLEIDAPTYAHFLAMTRKAGYKHAVLSSVRHVTQKDLSDIWSGLTCPAQAIFAADDPLIPVAGAKAIKSALPAARVDIIPDSRHEVAFTHPTKVANKVLAFLDAP